MHFNTLNVTNNKNDGSQRVKSEAKMNKSEKALATKKDKLRSRYCKQCDQMIIYDGTQGRKEFCNPACKMAYHRRLKAYHERWYGKPAAKPVYDRTVQQMINIAWANMVDVESAL